MTSVLPTVEFTKTIKGEGVKGRMTPRSIEYAIVRDPDALRERREELGLTIREVSRRASLKGHSFLYALETGGRHTCSADLAWRIGAALRLTHSQIRAYFDFREISRAA